MIRRLLLVALLVLVALPAAAQPNHFADVQAFVARYGLPDNANDEARRAWTDKVAETLAARYPAEGWGRKRSTPTNPLSADVVCTRIPFLGVDLLNGSTGEAQWAPTGDLTGQVFVDVTPHDWLAGATPPVDPPTEPGTGDTLPVVLARLEARLAALEAAVKAIPPCSVAAPVLTFPEYEGRIAIPLLGSAPLTLKPKAR